MSLDDDSRPVFDYYHGDGPVPTKRALVSYTVEPFHLDPESERFTSRQSMWQAIQIANLLNDHGFVVDVYPHDDPDVELREPDRYVLLLGFGRNFDRFARALPADAITIYYAIGAHWRWRNPAEERRLARVEERTGVSLPPERKLPETIGAEIADALIVLGDHYLGDDEFLKRSYLDNVGEKPAYNVRISSFDFLECAASEKDFESARRNFLWFGGSGLVLKGLDLVLETFRSSESLQLFICGPIEENPAFVDLYEEELYRTDNIHTLGYVNVTSDLFQDLTRRCGFIVNPSGSGVILPGAVITNMHRGVIPIVSAEVDPAPVDWGIVLEDTEIETIRETVRDASQLGVDVCRDMSLSSCREAKNNYTKATFRADMNAALTEILPSME